MRFVVVIDVRVSRVSSRWACYCSRRIVSSRIVMSHLSDHRVRAKESEPVAMLSAPIQAPVPEWIIRENNVVASIVDMNTLTTERFHHGLKVLDLFRIWSEVCGCDEYVRRLKHR